MFDKCFQPLFTGRLQHLGFEALDGKAQAMYLWFYWEGYGKGYETCPMGNAELQKLLGWSRNTVKDVLETLKNYGKDLVGHGIVEALAEFPPFEYRRPQVYRVCLPRIFVGRRWHHLEEEARKQAGQEGLAQLRAVLEQDPETRAILPLLSNSP